MPPIYSPKNPFIFPKNHLLSLKGSYTPPPSPFIIKMLFDCEFWATLGSYSFFPGHLQCVHEVSMLINIYLFYSLIFLLLQESHLRSQKGSQKIIFPPLQFKGRLGRLFLVVTKTNWASLQQNGGIWRKDAEVCQWAQGRSGDRPQERLELTNEKQPCSRDALWDHLSSASSWVSASASNIKCSFLYFHFHKVQHGWTTANEFICDCSVISRGWLASSPSLLLREDMIGPAWIKCLSLVQSSKAKVA